MSEYRLVREIGRGGMAVVYEAQRLLPSGIAVPAACKAIHPEYCDNEDVIELFCREASVCLAISTNHPNLVTVFDFFRDRAGRLLLAMELVDGLPLGYLSKRRRLPYPAIRRIVYETLAALVYVHGCGVLHRDVSPDNILISTRGEVKLSDFGLTKVLSDTRHRSQPVFKGKAPYASPEAIQCLALDARSDLWSLAALTHELLGGAPPFGHGDLLRIFSAMTELGPAPLPPDVPEDLRLVTADLTTMEPRERQFSTASTLMHALDALAGPMSTRAALGELVEQARRSGPAQPPPGALVDAVPALHAVRAGHPVTTPNLLAPLEERPRHAARSRSWLRWAVALLAPPMVLLLVYLVTALRRHEAPPWDAAPAHGPPSSLGAPLSPGSSGASGPAEAPAPAKPAKPPAPGDGANVERSPRRIDRRSPEQGASRQRPPRQERVHEPHPSRRNQELHIVPRAPILD